MNADLKIVVEQVETKVPVTVFHMRGWLDAQSEAQFLTQTQDAYDNGARFLLLDMSELDTVTSAGMRAIQKAYKIFSPEGDDKNGPPHMKLAAAPPQIYHVLSMTGFLQAMPMFETAQAALDDFKAALT